MDEALKPIAGFPGYSITRDGRVWSEKSSKWLKPQRTFDGYLQVSLWNGKKGHSYTIHRLLLETFIGPCPPGMESRHLDGNKLNNSLVNLQWDTRRENVADRLLHGTLRGNAKLNEYKVSWIRQLLSTRRYTNCRIAEVFGVGLVSIYNIKFGRAWKEVA